MDPKMLDDGEALFAAGYRQTSAKMRMVARVPPGMTPLEALKECAPKLAAHFKRVGMSTERVADYYRRTHAQGEDQLTLTMPQFRAFKEVERRDIAARWGVPTE